MRHCSRMNRIKLAFGLVACVALRAQPLATGNLLIATSKSHDPELARSVILLIHYDFESAIGLILNKPASVPITEVLPDAKGKSILVFAGGPVPIGVRGLLPSKASPYFTVVSNRTQLLRIIAAGEPPMRLYAGYTGWTAPQLQSEIARGLWKVLPPNRGALFDSHPETLWRGLQ
jgi:putative transcriptional regulator